TIQKAHFEHIAAKEAPPRIKHDSRNTRFFPLAMLVLRHHGCIAFLLAHLLGERTIWIVLKVATKCLNFPINADGFVYFPIAPPATASPVKQTQHTVRISITMPQEATKIICQTRKLVSRSASESISTYCFNRRTQIRCY